MSDLPGGPRPARFLDRSTPPHMGSLIAIAGVAGMSMNLFLPSLPAMAEDLGADYALMQLSVSGYLGLIAVIQLALGPLADRFGRRPVLIWAFALFCLGSVIAVFATTAPMFLLGRLLQSAVFSGVILARAIARDLATEDRAASMIGYITMGMAVVPMVSPAIGGALAGAFGWRSNFVLLFAIGAGGLWLILCDLGETGARGAASFPEQMRAWPALLGSGHAWAYTLVMAFSAGTFFAYLGGAPFVGAEVFGLDPGTLGLVFGLSSLGYATGSFISGRFSARHGVARMALAGTVINAGALVASLAVFGLGAGSAWTFFGFCVPVGIGYGLALPNATAGLLSVRPDLAGTASGLGGAVMMGVGATLAAFTGAWLDGDGGATQLLSVQVASALIGLAAALWIVRHRR